MSFGGVRRKRANCPYRGPTAGEYRLKKLHNAIVPKLKGNKLV